MIVLETREDQCHAERQHPPPAYFDDDFLSDAKRTAEKDGTPSSTLITPTTQTASTAPSSPTMYFDDDEMSAIKRNAISSPTNADGAKAAISHGALASPPPYDVIPTANVPLSRHEHGPHQGCRCARLSDVCEAHGHDPQVNIGVLVALVAFFPPALPFLLFKKKQRCRRCNEWVERKERGCALGAVMKQKKNEGGQL